MRKKFLVMTVISFLLIYSITTIMLIRKIEYLESELSDKDCLLEFFMSPRDFKSFSYVHKRFKQFNKKIDSKTIHKFVEVSKFYNLDTTDLLFDLCISQICLESGANHLDKNCDVITSSGHAIGITQIVPTTAFLFLKNELSKQDRKDFIELGATDFDFVNDVKKAKDVRPELIDWLCDETNNLILWGYIMHNTLEKRDYNINHSLIDYNAGGSILRKFIKSGKNPNNFDYIKRIVEIKNALNGKIND